MSTQIHPNTIRQILFVILILFLGVVISKELSFLLLPVLGAITFYVLLRNLFIKLIVDYKWKKWLAALVLILSSLSLIIAPFVWLVNYAIERYKPYITDTSLLQTKFNSIVEYVHSSFGVNIIKKEYLDKLNTVLLQMSQKVLGGTLNTLGIVAMMFFILYFMLLQTQDVESGLRKYIPLKGKNTQKLIQKSRSLVFSNAIGIPIVAIIQGLVSMIGYWIFGVDDFLLFGLLTAITSVIPVLGTMLVYIPLALYLLSIGMQWQGIAVAIWGFVVIGSVDNVARFLLQKKLSNVHPLVTIFGVIMGVNLFGFLGVIFGPILLSLFVTIVEIYVDEYVDNQEDFYDERN
jgi:predicted PurR-regulated permease PerM